jgi:uncharacterized Zn-finger protein
LVLLIILFIVSFVILLIAVFSIGALNFKYPQKKIMPCPHCKALYELDENELLNDTLNLTCPYCRTEFIYKTSSDFGN